MPAPALTTPDLPVEDLPEVSTNHAPAPAWLTAALIAAGAWTAAGSLIAVLFLNKIALETVLVSGGAAFIVLGIITGMLLMIYDTGHYHLSHEDDEHEKHVRSSVDQPSSVS